MPIGSIYQLTHKQRLFNEPMENVYFYRGLTSDATAADLIDAFQFQILDAVNNLQTDAVSGVDIRVISIGDFTDFAQETDTSTGNNPGTDANTSVAAVNLTLRTNVRNIGPGSKGYSGIGDEFIEANYIVDTDIIGFLNTLGTLLASQIGVGGADTYQPVIVKRIKVIPEDPDKRPYYRLPEDLAEADYADVMNTLINLKMSHQVSRGNGK